MLAGIADPCKEIKGIQQSVYDMLHHNTTDGLPYVEPELTDEDARQRIWVMVRDTEVQFWKGPRKFAAKAGQFHVFSFPDDALTSWNFCRRATPAEIAAAGLEVTE
jgi:hypothetical protein